MRFGRPRVKDEPAQRRDGDVVWDLCHGGAGPRVENGVFTIEGPRLWSRLLAMALLNLAMFAGARTAAAAAPILSAAPSDMHIPLGQTVTAAKVIPTACVHHDQHNDRNMSTLGGQHLDQHGDLSC